MSATPADWDQRFRERAWPNEPHPLLVEMAQDLPPGRAADLACGPGRNAIWLARRGFEVTGVDSSAVGLAQAAERAAAASVQLHLEQADLLSYRLPPRRYDLVVIANFHPQPAELAPLLARIASGLSAGGHLCLVGHHRDNLGLEGPSDPRLLYTLAEVRRALPVGLMAEVLERRHRHPGAAGREGGSAVLLWARRVRPRG